MISLRYIRSRRTDIFFYLLASVIPALLLVVINPFLAKNLSPDDYAVIGYISSFASLATPVVSMMLMRYYFVNYFKVDAQRRLQIKRSIIHALILVSFIMSVLVVLAITYYHIRFNSSSTIPLYPYLLLSVSAIWLGSLYVFQLAEYRIRRMSRAYFRFSISQGVFKIILLLVLVVLVVLHLVQNDGKIVTRILIGRVLAQGLLVGIGCSLKLTAHMVCNTHIVEHG